MKYMFKIIKKNLIIIAIIIAGVCIGGAIVYVNQRSKGGGVLSPKQAANKVLDYINKNILKGQAQTSLIEVKEESGLYKMRAKIGDEEIDLYVSQDGKLLFPQFINLEVKVAARDETTTQPVLPEEISQRDVPDVKLFVMSYCPFGLQMEKAFLPVYDLLKDKAEMGIYFVNYIMHGKKELDENLRQYCIQKEQNEKYSNYLSCFVKDGDFEKCLSEAKIDKDKINSCISQTDKEYKITQLYNDKSTWLNGRFPKFDVHSDLNEKYRVRGSPTLVINGQVIQVTSRSPEAVKNAICQAFTEKPPECSQALSTDVASPGFGEGTGSSSEGGCG
jgi:hypothetical protein